MTTLLKCVSITKYFDGNRAVARVSFSIEKGSIVSLIGPNGAGKTTLFNVISGFLRPDEGKIFYKKEHDVTSMPPHKIAAMGIGRTFQELRLIDRMTAFENIQLALPNQKGITIGGALLGRHFHDKKSRREEAIDWLDYVGVPNCANTLAAELSYGQQKLVSVACCLALGAELLLLDEPVAGVNPGLIDNMVNLLLRLQADNGKTIVLIEHNMNAVMEISNRVIAMDYGRIIADGTPKEVRDNPAVIEVYLT